MSTQAHHAHTVRHCIGGQPCTPERRDQILFQQQQKLLYLRHASKCNVSDGGVCPYGYPNCQGMKRLFAHVADCREETCQYPHCISSRYVLSHYHKCTDIDCPLCAPVRRTIQASHGELTCWPCQVCIANNNNNNDNHDNTRADAAS